MENNYSNYDMLDKMIDNRKKAKSWTAFWMIILCLMAGAVLWLAYTVSEKNKTISQQVQVIQSNEFNLEVKSRIIDSLTENCNKAKTQIVKSCDSVITQTQNAILSIATAKNDSGKTMQITASQQEKLKEATTSIQTIKTNLYQVRADILKTNTKLFVQFNNTANTDQVNRLLTMLKSKSSYVIAPSEYIDKVFPTVIKFYNYKNADEEKYLKNILADLFKLSPDNIQVKYEENPNIKTTVEIWIGTRTRLNNLLEISKPG